MKTGKLRKDRLMFAFSKSHDNNRAHSNSRWRRLRANMWSFNVF